MSEKLVRLASGAGESDMELTIGHAQWGSYELYLWDPEGRNFEMLGAGLK